MKDTREFIKGADTSLTNSAKMTIRLKPAFEHDRIKARMIAAKLQLSPLYDYIQKYQIFFEEFGNPVHPKYVHEKEIYEQFAQNNIQRIPQMEPFCFRIELSTEKLLDRGITVLEIVRKLQLMYSELFIVSTYETDRKFGPILRAHPIKGKATWVNSMKTLEKFHKGFIHATVRGIDRISQVAEVQTRVHKWNETTGTLTEDDIYIITTLGSNIVGMLSVPELEHTMIQTTSAAENQRMLGLAAARTRIMIEWTKMAPGVTKNYFSLIASHMTATSSITGINVTGQLRREPNNVFSNACVGHATGVILKACVEEKTSMFYGTSGPTIMGQSPMVGTGYFDVGVDVKMLQKHKHVFKSSGINSIIDNLDDLN
jgi:hypothetical protein